MISKLKVEDIINGMNDWVRVIDREDNVLYVNKAMKEDLASSPIGRKCYEVIGRNKPCDICISRKTVFKGISHEKEEHIGNKIYSVLSSPVSNKNDEIVAVVEVLRDITLTRQLQKQIMIQNKKLQSDLNIAKKLQCSLLPKQLPEDKLDFSFVYKPCEALGGDFFDVFNRDEDHIGIYIADVSGHGVPASMLTVFLRSSFNKNTISPSAALVDLFREFNAGNFDEDLYITVFFAVINTKKRKITYSNAGHNVSPIIFNTERFELLRIPGIPISNWMEHPSYTDVNLDLQKADKIFLYTDGIVETRNRKGEQYGEERLLNLLLNNLSSPSETLSTIMADAESFFGLADNEMCDDITMALVEIL